MFAMNVLCLLFSLSLSLVFSSVPYSASSSSFFPNSLVVVVVSVY